MSGYPDDGYDRDDDRNDDRDRRDDDDDIRTAKSMVTAPAVGLIVVAAFGLVSIVLNLIQFGSLDAQFDAQIREIEANPQFTADQKKQQVEMMNKIRDVAKVAALPLIGVVGVVSIVILVGGLKPMSLSGSGLVYLSAILSLVPCISGCCFLGLIFGIWAMVALAVLGLYFK